MEYLRAEYEALFQLMWNIPHPLDALKYTNNWCNLHAVPWRGEQKDIPFPVPRWLLYCALSAIGYGFKSMWEIPARNAGVSQCIWLLKLGNHQCNRLCYLKWTGDFQPQGTQSLCQVHILKRRFLWWFYPAAFPNMGQSLTSSIDP